jgi:hypothetical protein
MVKDVNVLGAGTKISVIVESRLPARAVYLIERTVPNPPVVRLLDVSALLSLRGMSLALWRSTVSVSLLSWPATSKS